MSDKGCHQNSLEVLLVLGEFQRQLTRRNILLYIHMAAGISKFINPEFFLRHVKRPYINTMETYIVETKVSFIDRETKSVFIPV